MNSVARRFMDVSIGAGLAVAVGFGAYIYMDKLGGRDTAQAQKDTVQEQKIAVAPQAGPIVNYKGADGDVAALNDKIREMSKGRPLFVMYFAEWCGFCRSMTADFLAMDKEMPGTFGVLRVDVDLYPGLVDAVGGIRGTPETDVFLDGKLAHKRIPGRAFKNVLVDIVQKLSPAPGAAPVGTPSSP